MWLLDPRDMDDTELQMQINACKIILNGETPQVLRDEAESDLRELLQEQERRKKEEWIYPISEWMIPFN